VRNPLELAVSREKREMMRLTMGCERIVMSGFGGGSGQIEVLDLDTIDLSNLNRQFLFQKQHVKRPKAVVSSLSPLIYVGASLLIIS
jgi:hypothetical protein